MSKHLAGLSRKRDEIHNVAQISPVHIIQVDNQWAKFLDQKPSVASAYM